MIINFILVLDFLVKVIRQENKITNKWENRKSKEVSFGVYQTENEKFSMIPKYETNMQNYIYIS